MYPLFLFQFLMVGSMVTGDNDLFIFVYRMLQSKQAHVQYSTDKAITFYRSMVNAINKNMEAVDNTTQTVNRIYAFRKRIKNKIEKIDGSGKQYCKNIIKLLDEVLHELVGVSDNISHYSGLMRNNTDSLLITILKARHYQWREKVYMSVLGKTNTIPADDEFSCFLGWWYHDKGNKKFGRFPPFIKLGTVHRKLHQVTAELAKEDLQYPDTRALMRKLEEFESISVSVITALDELDEYLIRIADHRDNVLL
ncbi:CZB domain-containing protein [Salmonella enterica]|nr:CZB domain-containing protein [Salmonella enterica]